MGEKTTFHHVNAAEQLSVLSASRWLAENSGLVHIYLQRVLEGARHFIYGYRNTAIGELYEQVLWN